MEARKQKSPESEGPRALISKSQENYFFFLAVFFLATFFLVAFFLVAMLFPPVERPKIERATDFMVTRFKRKARGHFDFFSFFYCLSQKRVSDVTHAK